MINMNTSALVQPEELHPLKHALLAEYGHFADRRIKNPDKSNRFIIDDRDHGPSFASDGMPYGWFCEMFAEVVRPDAVRITIRGNLPMGPNVVLWLEKNSAEAQQPFAHQPPIHNLTITPINLDELLTLADALMAIVHRRMARKNSDWYVAPRVAGSLRRIHAALKQHWEVGI